MFAHNRCKGTRSLLPAQPPSWEAPAPSHLFDWMWTTDGEVHWQAKTSDSGCPKSLL